MRHSTSMNYGLINPEISHNLQMDVTGRRPVAYFMQNMSFDQYFHYWAN